MCADPATKEAITAIKREIETLQERVERIENTVNGDGTKEKGVIPRLSTIEAKTNALLAILGAIATALIPAVLKYLFGF